MYLTGLWENAKVKNRSVEPNIGVGGVVIQKGEGTANCQMFLENGKGN